MRSLPPGAPSSPLPLFVPRPRRSVQRAAFRSNADRWASPRHFHGLAVADQFCKGNYAARKDWLGTMLLGSGLMLFRASR